MIQKAAQSIDDRQAKAETRAPIAIRFAEAIELAEYLFMLVGRNSGPGVPYLNAQSVFPAAAADNETTKMRVAHGVRYQIENDPFEQDEVAADPCPTMHDAERQSFFPGSFRKCRLGISQKFLDWEIGDGFGGCAGVEL